MTERQCPLCHIHAIRSPHGQCANANCPPFEGWPEDGRFPPIATFKLDEVTNVLDRRAGEAEPSPAPLVEVETVDGSRDSPRLDDRGGGGHVADLVPPQGADLAPGEASPSLKLLPKVELIMPAPQPIRTLGETLGNILKAATERADKLAQKVQASSDELHKVMDATEEVSQDMDRVTADMKSKLGLGGNGGPAL